MGIEKAVGKWILSKSGGLELSSALLADTLRCSCPRSPRGAAPCRRLRARQPGRCDATRSLTVSFYRWKTRHRVLPPACSLSPVTLPAPCRWAREMPLGGGSSEGALASPGKVFPSSFAPGAEAGPCSASSRRGPNPLSSFISSGSAA